VARARAGGLRGYDLGELDRLVFDQAVLAAADEVAGERHHRPEERDGRDQHAAAQADAALLPVLDPHARAGPRRQPPEPRLQAAREGASTRPDMGGIHARHCSRVAPAARGQTFRLTSFCTVRALAELPILDIIPAM